ncbi:K(+)/H(+) antiporter [Mortierella sp. AD094]|nr:K(+)/H(+) antiporter [Mortierella sp. AD094]
MNATNGTTAASPEGGNILSGENPIQVSLSDPLPLFIVQTIIILSLCYGVNMVLSRIRQPRVVSEVLSGIILGPSILGQIPGFNNIIFPPQSIPFLTLVANLGLVLFLFLVGLELDPKLILKRAKHALGISIAGLLIPFVLSCGAALLLYRDFEKPTTTTPAPPFGEFLLTCGVAMSLTAFPVLARILAEMQLMSTTVGFITVCAAAAGDILAWILLALLVSLINSTTPIMPLYVVLMAIAWCVILVYIVRPILLSLVRLTHSEEEPSQKMIAITLVIVLTSAFVTNIIGIHAIFGGFLVGLLIPHDSGFAEGLTRRLEDLVGVYFLPIFFTCSGLKTQVGLLNNGETWGLVIMVTSISCFGKMLGCTSAAKANGMTWREAFSIGFLMNCKGLVEYIILNIGHDAGVISDRVFVIMIAMCLILTMIATPFVGFLYPVSYQREMEVRREAERKLQALEPRKRKEEGSDPQSTKGGLFSSFKDKLRRRKSPKNLMVEKIPEVSGDHYEDLDGIRVDTTEHYTSPEDQALNAERQWRKKNSIMFCLDKTPNAPGVMTLLQLFSGTMPLNGQKHRFNSAREDREMQKADLDQNRERYQGVLQPSIDISNPSGNTRAEPTESSPEYEIGYSNVYAIRLLHISERTSAAMLTASRCMDRLYKDTVMMMVMAFAKLNSIPLKPLVAISTDTAQSTVAQDILDRAEDLNVGWIVYPWNSSHLSDLPTPAPTTPHSSGNGHPNPGITMSMVNTTMTANSTVSLPGTPAVVQEQSRLQPAGPSDKVIEAPRQFPYNVSIYFDHDESQKIASGGHVDLSQGGQSHRMSIASNTKVLSKLIPASADSNIATAVLVDRGLGLFGGVEHIVVLLLEGEDDYEALCLASCLARSTKCFVTILRISNTRGIHQSHGQQRTSHAHQHSIDRSMPPTPDGGARFPDGSSRIRNQPTDNLVPKDDNTLFKKFFPCKTPRQAGQSYQRKRSQQRNAALGRAEQDVVDDMADEVYQEEGVVALPFQEFSDAMQWARTCLTPQDLVIVGFDSNASMLQSSGPTTANGPFSAEKSRAPSMDGTGVDVPSSPPQPGSPPTILERRGINLSPPQKDNLLLPHPVSHDATQDTSSALTPAVGTPAPRASFEEERAARSRVVERSRSKGARSLRSLSRGRKAETPGAGSGQPQVHATPSPMTTCQVMLGLTADKMIQSCVVSSLLVVRSRWYSQRKVHDVGSPASGLSHFRLHTGSTGTSHHRVGSNDRNNHEGISDQTRQYHSLQQQHHARQHSKLSQELRQDIVMTNSTSAEKPREPDVAFVDMLDVDADVSKETGEDSIPWVSRDLVVPIRVFVAGVTSFIGPTAASRYTLRALVRSSEKAERDIRPLGIEPAIGSLDDSELLTREASNADVVLSFADANHLPSIKAILKGLQHRPRLADGCRRPIFIHTSGSALLLDGVYGNVVGMTVYRDDDYALIATIPPTAPNRDLDLEVVSPSLVGHVDTYIVSPPTIWGYDTGKPEGDAENRSGRKPLPKNEEAYYFAQQGEDISYGELGQDVANVFKELGVNNSGDVIATAREDASKYWPTNINYLLEGLGGNSRSRTARGREFLGWEPKHTDYKGYIAQEIRRQLDFQK